ncbi:penicillin acylase family protein, partial [Pseudocolwellia agarivorans]|uniref:penicillin acylase family protein n=1 Tax=Pseudocolwellia agarivorans TaxID=1911682 RepID=UPI0011155553
MWYPNLTHLRNLSAISLAITALMTAACTTEASKPIKPKEVTIHRDEYGVPHVVAKTSDAVMFGAGYALAQDRLASMELSRRSAVGRR